MEKFIQGLRKSASAVYLVTEEDIAHDLSEKFNKAARLLEQMSEREKKCPTMVEAESRALLRSLQETACAVGLDTNEATPRQTVNAVTTLCVNQSNLLEACKAAYRKHHMNDDSIGWDELSDLLLDALCNALGPDGYQKWVDSVSVE